MIVVDSNLVLESSAMLSKMMASFDLLCSMVFFLTSITYRLQPAFKAERSLDFRRPPARTIVVVVSLLLNTMEVQ